MNILLKGYIDRNFGDDLMLRIAARGLREHNVRLDVPENDLMYIYERFGMIPYNDGDIQTECTVIGSGFIIRSKVGLLYRTKEIIEQKQRKSKKAVLGCNISEFTVKGAEWLIRRQLADYDFITVRDTFSRNYIRKNVSKAKCEYYPDIVFSIPDDMLYNTPSEGALGITAYNRLLTNSVAEYEKLARVADNYIEKTGRKVLIFAFDTGIENDTAAARAIARNCKNAENIEIINNDGDDSILKNLPRCSKLVAIRFHGMVLGLRMGIPIIPIAYSNKMRNVLTDLEYSDPILDASNFSAEEIEELAITNNAGYKLPREVTELAGMHIKRFLEEFSD